MHNKLASRRINCVHDAIMHASRLDKIKLLLAYRNSILLPACTNNDGAVHLPIHCGPCGACGQVRTRASLHPCWYMLAPRQSTTDLDTRFAPRSVHPFWRLPFHKKKKPIFWSTYQTKTVLFSRNVMIELIYSFTHSTSTITRTTHKSQTMTKFYAI
jgi:hypothetical protein